MSLALTWGLLSASVALAADVDRVPEDFATLQQAIDEGQAHVIELGPGVWEGAVLTRPVHLRGDGAVITAGAPVGQGRAGLHLLAGASGSTVQGLEFHCQGPNLDFGVFSSDRHGGAAEGVVVQGNTFLGCVQGVTVASRPASAACAPEVAPDHAGWLIAANHFRHLATRLDNGGRGGGLGVVAYHTVGAEVVDNTFSGRAPADLDFGTAAVNLSGCHDCTVAGNVVQTEGRSPAFTPVLNGGAQARGGAPSSGLWVFDNALDPAEGSSGLVFRSQGSFDVHTSANNGEVQLDHLGCGDGRQQTVDESR